ncbi:MAG: hypothetical protein ACE5F7_08700, partial [Nitrospiria bacterium]
MPTPFQTMSQLGDTLKGIVEISNGTVRVLDARRMRGPLIDGLIETAVFHEKAEMRGTARWLIKMTAPALGIHFKTNTTLDTQAQGTIPSIQITGMAYGTALVFFHAAVRLQVGAFAILRPASEQGRKYTSRDEAVLTAAAIQEGFRGFLFFKDQLPLNPCHTDIETVFRTPQKKDPVEVIASTASDKALKITVAVSKEKNFQRWFSEGLQEKLSLEIGEHLKAHLENCHALSSARRIREELQA